jgi:hypothetical protein
MVLASSIDSAARCIQSVEATAITPIRLLPLANGPLGEEIRRRELVTDSYRLAKSCEVNRLDLPAGSEE